MVNAGCYGFNDKMETTFLLKQDMKQYPCPSFKGKAENKQKVYRAWKEEMDPEVRANLAYSDTILALPCSHCVGIACYTKNWSHFETFVSKWRCDQGIVAMSSCILLGNKT